MAGKADCSLVDRGIELELDEPSILQIFLYKFFDHTSDSETDSCELDQKIHRCHFEQVVCRDVVETHVVVNVMAGDVVLVEKHDVADLKDIGIRTLADAGSQGMSERRQRCPRCP